MPVLLLYTLNSSQYDLFPLIITRNCFYREIVLALRFLMLLLSHLVLPITQMP